MRHRHDPVVERVGTTLHVRMDDITHEPPRRWVELIHYLDEQEQMQSARLHRETQPGDGQPSSASRSAQASWSRV